jgi:signal transduction histidine kinase/CheY-like chemotaxis protein
MKGIWNLSIKLKISIGFALILIVLVSVQYSLNKSINNVISSQEELLVSTKLSTEIESIKSSVCFFESKVKGYVLTGNDTLLENNEKYLDNVVLKFRDLKKLSPTKKQAAAIDTLVVLLNKEIQFADEVIFQYSLSPKRAVKLIKDGGGRMLMVNIINEFEKIHTIEEAKFTKIIAQNKQDSNRVKEMDASAYILAFLLIVVCVGVISSDINRRHKLEKKLIITQKKAEDAAIIKEQFMANMSHEIRTPMNAIIGFNNRLSKTTLNDEQKEYVEAVQSSGENLLAIINDILDFSKIEAGMVRIEQINFNLPALLNGVHTLFAAEAKEKKIQLQFHVSEHIPEMVMGDPTRLTQILVNLVGNAMKFTKKGNIDVVVKVLKEENESTTFEFNVQDTGIGISVEKIDEIFERFTQAKSDTSRIYGGTGLGLSIVKKLVELQNGTINVTSEKDKGSLFTVIIPYKKTKVLSPVLDEKVIAEKNYTAEKKNKIKILVVEDNLLNQKLAGFILNDWGFDYDICANGKLAIEKLKDNTYGLILMDIQMPEMNGYETTEFIRQNLHLTIPIIAMTAHALPGEKEKCVSFGMTDHISKPIKEPDLYELITTYLNITIPEKTNSIIS